MFLQLLALSSALFATSFAEYKYDVVPGRYIVQLKTGVSAAEVQAHHVMVRSINHRHAHIHRRGGDACKIAKTYNIHNFNAYAGIFDDMSLEAIKNLPEVLAVVPDTLMRPTELNNFDTNSWVKRDLTTQESAPWGLGHLSHHEPGSTEYVYDSSAGEGTYVYVVDTGIRTTHSDFEGRATFGFNAVEGTSNLDDAGHGTGVASIAVGKTFGVAKKANVIAVKVFAQSSGTASDVMEGFNWAVNDIVSKDRVNASVINMSLTGQYSSIWDSALQNAHDLGVMSVVASGNDNVNASSKSPASSPFVMTVGNVNRTNGRHNDGPGFGSNYGQAVDIFAPGVEIVCASQESDTSTQTETGTSQAAPQVAGLVSYLRTLEGLQTTEQVTKRILELATKDVVKDPKGSANLVAYNGSGK